MRGQRQVIDRAPDDPSGFVRRALAHAETAGGGDAVRFESTGEVRRTSSGWHVVPLQQVFCGIPVLHGVRAVRFDAAGEPVAFTGSTIAVPADVPVLPVTPAAEASRIAFLELARLGAVPEHLAFTAAAPDVIAEAGGPGRWTVLRKAPLDDAVVAALIVDARPRNARGLGFFDNRTDGHHPTLELGRHVSGRHTAFDGHPVTHEFAHGVTNRIVGAALAAHAARASAVAGAGRGVERLLGDLDPELLPATCRACLGPPGGSGRGVVLRVLACRGATRAAHALVREPRPHLSLPARRSFRTHP